MNLLEKATRYSFMNLYSVLKNRESDAMTPSLKFFRLKIIELTIKTLMMIEMKFYAHPKTVFCFNVRQNLLSPSCRGLDKIVSESLIPKAT